MAEKDIVPVISKMVTIEGDEFCLEFVPKKSTKLVMNEKNTLTASLDLPELVGGLQKLGSFIRVAYYGVAGFTELKISVQRIGFTVAELSQESEVTVILFKKAAKEIIETLQSTYGYLTDGLEDIAIENLNGLAAVADKMAADSKRLQEEFVKAKKMVQETLEKAIRKQGSEEEHAKEMKNMQATEEANVDKERDRKMAAAQAEASKKELYLDADKREKKAENSIDNLLKKISSVPYLLFTSLKEACDQQVENEKRKAEQAREERLRFLKESEEHRDAQLKANMELRDCVLRIQQAKVEEGLSDSAITALQGAQQALTAIAFTMMEAETFWRLMSAHCGDMGSKKMQTLIEKNMKLSEAKRQRIWGSDTFIKDAVRYYAKWVALEDVCGSYLDEVRTAKKEMQLYMKENPTTVEARKKLPVLAMALKTDLEEAIKKMERENENNKKEKEAIEQSKAAESKDQL